jgi:outer membrane protein OmpA-like peptidoglycan-associated protein
MSGLTVTETAVVKAEIPVAEVPEPQKPAPVIEPPVGTSQPEPPSEPSSQVEQNKEAAVEMTAPAAPALEEKSKPKTENTLSIQPEIPVVQHQTPAPTAEADATQLASFHEISNKLSNGSLAIGDRFRLDGAVYDPVVWQLTPRITGPLDDLISLLKKYPSLQVEISSHTEALGVDEDNLHISQNRASTVLDYLIREGIPKERVVVKGCGETMLLNQCKNGVICTMKEHLVNQRLEVKVIGLDGRS